VGTVGLIAWLVTPPIFVLIVALVAIALYARSITLGVSWTKCFLRRPSLIIGVWAAIAITDAYWLVVLGGRLPSVEAPFACLTAPDPSGRLRRLWR
jgi:hypothetical protein